MNAHPIVRQIIDRDCHVAMPHRNVIRHVISRLKNGYATFRGLSKTDRRRLLEDCIRVHDDNRSLYQFVMTGSRRRSSKRRQGMPKSSNGFPESLSGRDIVRLMRKHQKSISALAFRMGITQKRIRQVRSKGLANAGLVRDWMEAITGIDPGPISTRYIVKDITEEGCCSQCGSPLETTDVAYDYVGDMFCSVGCCRRSRGWT